MIQQEFNTQVFRTQDQWDSGFTYHLEKLNGGGITLYSTPTFARWEEKGVKNPGVLAIDECGLIYYIETGTWTLYRYDPNIQSQEHVPCISGLGGEPGKVEIPKRILFNKSTMWVLDTGNERIRARIQAFSRENFQIRYIIDDLENPVDMALDKSGYIYVIEKNDSGYHIITYDTNGQRIEKRFDDSCLKDPISIAVYRDDIYVIDRELKKFIKFTDGKFSVLGDLSKLNPSNIVIDKSENIFVLDETGSIYQFDPDGGCQGKINIPDSSDPIKGIAIDSKGDLYASGKKGIAIFITQKKYTREQGFYYSKTLDSGIDECKWHRLALDAEIPQKSILEIYFYCSDNKSLKDDIDDLIRSNKKTIQEKASILDEKLHWIGPERYFSSEEIRLNGKIDQPGQKTNETKTDLNDRKLTWVGSKKDPRNILFRGNGGRYLWLKIVLSTFDENVRPIIREMKVFYPHISYLRYLPAIYQENESSKEFLEKLLSIFETVFNDLETEISEVFKYFDPDTTPKNFLSWLASWMNLALEEGWKEEKSVNSFAELLSCINLKGPQQALRN